MAVLEDDELRAFHDIEFSLDYPTQAEQDAQRGNGNWELIHQQAERCVRLGVPVTIIAVMMKANYLRLAEVARVAKKFDAPLRVNVYQAVRSDIYALSLRRILGGVPVPLCGNGRNRDWRAAGSSHGRPAAAPGRMWRKHRESYAARHHTAMRLLARIGRTAFRFRSPWDSTFSIPRPSNKPARFPKRASLASSGIHAMAAAPDVDACRTRCWILTFIVLSFAGNALTCRSAWPQRATCQSSAAPALQS